jgi:hypothetical protein
MTFLIYSVMFLFLTAIAITIFAIVSAPEGYEDHAGFHVVRHASRRTAQSLSRSKDQPVLRRSTDSDEDSEVPPFLPVH